MANGKNIETRLNELYLYVNSPDRAFHVANLFKQALLSQSSIVCSILGIILSENIDHDSNLSYEDLIVFNALQTATDYEILYLDKVLKKFMVGRLVDEEKVENEEEASKWQYDMAIKWARNNRILTEQGNKVRGDTFSIGSGLYTNLCTDKLCYYIDKSR